MTSSHTPMCSNQEQAILVVIASEAGAMKRATGGHVSRRALMHAFCYAKMLGMKTLYGFDIYPSGPISTDVIRDIAWLECDRAIENKSDDPEHYADYHLASGSLALCALHRDHLENWRPKLREILEAMAPLTSAHLLLVSHLYFAWLAWVDRAAMAGVTLKDQVIAEVLAAELPKTTPETAADTYDSLHRLGLIVEPAAAATEAGGGVSGGEIEGSTDVGAV